jgi:Helix-turn-helix domain
MNEPPQDVRSLATLSPAERSRALERYRLLQPCTEDGVPLTHVARHQGTPLRTLQLWLAQYRHHGLAGLARRPRRDRGQPHGLPPDYAAFCPLTLIFPRQIAVSHLPYAP